jgi:dTDP-4-dehydrorhamnose reductase
LTEQPRPDIASRVKRDANMAKSLLVTGARGFVAGSVIRSAGPEWELHALSRGQELAGHAELHWHHGEPSETDQLAQLFRQVQPTAVIHCAALADIDYCQTHQAAAWKANVGLTETLANLCATSGAKLVFCSTDTVFDGERAPYREDDPPGPVNFYGQTKVAAEQVVTSSRARGVIARLSLVVGLPALGPGNSFLSKMVAALRAGREVGVPVDEIRTPIDVITLGQALLELAGGDDTGIFHLSGNDRLSRLDMAQQIAVRLGFSPSLIVANDPARIPGRAPRPRDVSLANGKARAALKTRMHNFAEGLSLILETDKSPVR